jgi:hypothetical protein
MRLVALGVVLIWRGPRESMIQGPEVAALMRFGTNPKPHTEFKSASALRPLLAWLNEELGEANMIKRANRSPAGRALDARFNCITNI